MSQQVTDVFIKDQILLDLIKKHWDVLKRSLLIRRVEEKLLDLYSQGKLNGTVHTCIGQEVIGPTLAQFLASDDHFVSNHRGHGHYIAKTGDVAGLFAEIMGKQDGVCSGFGGSQHLLSDGFISNGIQGGMVPVASGMALSNKLNSNTNIVVAFIGDGTLGEGAVYEAFNLASIWNLPILIVVENNGYAQSTCQQQTFAGNLKQRVEGFGLKYLKTDTWNMDFLTDSAEECISFVRDKQTPCLLEIETYRLKAHSKSDDNRDTNEVKIFNQRDVLSQVVNSSSTQVFEALSTINSQIDVAVSEVSEGSDLKLEQKAPLIISSSFAPLNHRDDVGKRINDLIHEALREFMSNNDKGFIMGEDVEYETPYTAKPYGGAFKVTNDLSKDFPGRVRNTPISESAIVGLGTGLSLKGYRPVIEIMFGDFLLLTFDQIANHATKFCEMFGQSVDVPLVIRTPMGGGRGYGPTHSQSLEKHFLGIPNLAVVALNHRINPKDIYSEIFRQSHTPTLVIENKILYTRRLSDIGNPGFELQSSDEAFPTVLICPTGNIPADITVLCYGGMLEVAEGFASSIFMEEEIACDILCPTSINGFNTEILAESLKRSGRLLIVEEGNNTAAFGSETVTKLLESGLQLKALKRVSNNEIIPCALEAEKNLLPSVRKLTVAAKEML